MGLEFVLAVVFVTEFEGGVCGLETEAGIVFWVTQDDEVADGVLSLCTDEGEAVVDELGADALALVCGEDGYGG